jgi:hypothetical protein
MKVVAFERTFLRKYILPSFAVVEWDTPSVRLTDAHINWRLWVTNIRAMLQERPELPRALLASVLSDSLILFRTLYGSVQPSEARAMAFRMEMMRIVETVDGTYPGEIPEQVQHEAHFLVLLAAITGATDHEIAECVPEDGNEKYHGLFLDLEVNPPDFGSYPKALARLASAFAGDPLDLGRLAAFVRGKFRRILPGAVMDGGGDTEGGANVSV